MSDQDATTFAKAILARTITTHGQTTGRLGPTDPLTISDIKAVAEELDVPASMVDAALDLPVVHEPTRANSYVATVDRYIAATPDTIIREAKPHLLYQEWMRVLAPIADGIVFTPIEPNQQGGDPDRIASRGDTTLTILPIGHDGVIARLALGVESPWQMVLPAMIGFTSLGGPFTGYMASVLVKDVTTIWAYLMLGAVIAAVAGGLYTYHLWQRGVRRTLLHLTGAADAIAKACTSSARTPEPTSGSVAEDVGTFVGRFLNGLYAARRSRRIARGNHK